VEKKQNSKMDRIDTEKIMMNEHGGLPRCNNTTCISACMEFVSLLFVAIRCYIIMGISIEQYLLRVGPFTSNFGHNTKRLRQSEVLCILLFYFIIVDNCTFSEKTKRIYKKHREKKGKNQNG
jgi:hypothetical protein